MHIAASWGCFDSMQLLRRNGADVVDMSNVNGETPLFVASSHDDFDMARLLIDNGADLNTVSCFGDAPWQHICRNGKLELARLFLENSVDVNEVSVCGEAPLHVACRRECNLEMLRLLLDYHADVNKRSDWDDATPLFAACGFRNLKAVRLFHHVILLQLYWYIDVDISIA
jgi:ankyrin repeat protein